MAVLQLQPSAARPRPDRSGVLLILVASSWRGSVDGSTCTATSLKGTRHHTLIRPGLIIQVYYGLIMSLAD